jgi:hypothetical protein
MFAIPCQEREQMKGVENLHLLDVESEHGSWEPMGEWQLTLSSKMGQYWDTPNVDQREIA